jgi:adenine phosphoribosyltransferase
MLSLDARVLNAIRNVSDFPKKGVEFKDVTPLLLDVALSNEIVTAFADAGKEMGVTMVAGIESRGFFFGSRIAAEIGVPFVPIRKRSVFPGNQVEHYTYDLEYGSSVIEMNARDMSEDAKVMIHDDLLATGSTASAAAKLIRNAGAEVTMFAFIAHLTYLDGAENLLSISPNIFTIAEL